MESPISGKALILQVLLGGEHFGLEIIEKVLHKTNNKIEIFQGSLYPALKGLQKEKFIKGVEVKSEGEPGRAKVFWSLTKKGKKLALEHKEIFKIFGK